MKGKREKKLLGFIFLFLLAASSPSIRSIRAQSSTHYTMRRSVFDQAGGFSHSAYYQVKDAVGQSMPIEVVRGSHYVESSGFFAGGGLLTGVKEKNWEKVPAQFFLFQNYPNPFNPSTTIRYSLAEASEISLKLFNVRGREVREIDHGPKKAGVHKITFLAKDLPSGVYFYYLTTAKGFLQIRKLILLK